MLEYVDSAEAFSVVQKTEPSFTERVLMFHFIDGHQLNTITF